MPRLPQRKTLLSLPFLLYQGKGTSPMGETSFVFAHPAVSRQEYISISYFCIQSTNYVKIVWLSHFVMNDQCVFKYLSLFAQKKTKTNIHIVKKKKSWLDISTITSHTNHKPQHQIVQTSHPIQIPDVNYNAR
jgi:hypothetical protein